MTAMRPEPPYPPDTRAKGWRFELDHERIRQSDTWAVAPPEVRPWLLLLWMVAWEQTPCGAMPAEPGLIAARIGMTPKMFDKHRAVLMRGWKEASDGRLYHPVVTERVLELLAYRDASAKRKADYRAKLAAEKAVAPESRVSPTSVPRDSTVRNATGTGTGTGTIEEKEKDPPASRVPPSPKPKPLKRCPAEFLVTADLQQWARATVPLVDIRAETAAFRDWEFRTGKVDWPATWRVWMTKEQKRLSEGAARDAKRNAGKASPRSFKERETEAADAEVRAWTGGKGLTAKPHADPDNTIDMGATHAVIGHD